MKNKILVVEDNAVNRKLLSKMLQEEYEICEASNGKKALEILKSGRQKFAAMILDLQMPELNGRDVLKVLNQNSQFKNLPVLVATGEHNEQIESECLSLGAWDYVTKPYSKSVISVRLNNIIARSQNALLKEVQRLSQRDLLTGLYNRRYFMQKAKEMIMDNPETVFCMVRADIDHFRLYNASFGSEAGDDLLRQVAQQLEREIPPECADKSVYGRIESDIFCMCMPYDKDVIERIVVSAEKNIQVISDRYRLKASFGICMIQNPLEDMEELYAHAAEAAKKCKHNLNTYMAYYDQSMSEKEKRDQALTNAMEDGIAEKQFLVYLQPKYSMDTDKPCGAEALVRWKHPECGMISPGEFIPVFEQNGLIVQLDYYMWENVCILLNKWMAESIPVVPISVNVSRVSMYDPNVVQFLTELTDQYQVPRHLLNLEITESAYMSNPDLMKNIIEELRASGFVILMDDFGSGYSSLNTLKDIDVDILKIDMKFLPTGQNNVKSEKILASIVRMAGWLGMPVVVEGVETKEQKDFLESIGCYYVQGYYYAKPMPVAEFEILIEKEQPYDDDTQENAKLQKEMDVVWSSDSGTGALLESVSLPFAIFEHAENKTDILRMNKAFIKAFPLKNLERYMSHKEYGKLLNTIDIVVLNREKAECECMMLLENGETKWYDIRLAFIGMVRGDALVSGTFTDVTTEAMLESELNKIAVAFQTKKSGKSSIMIVDDQEISRDILASMFEEDYQIIPAKDGKEALKLLQEQHQNIAAILLDMVMPIMDGREFLSYKNRMEEASDIPIMVISAESDEAVQLNMLENGVNDYVTKPFVPALVKKRLENVLEYNSRFRTMVREYRSTNNTVVSSQIDPPEQCTSKVDSMVYQDPLTGAYNRRFLDEMLFLCMGKKRETTQLTLVMMDLTRFKQINDLFGHQMGDKVLKGVVVSMKKQIRAEDSIIRFGGDEFIVILVNCGKEQALASIERLRVAVREVKYGPKETIAAEADFGYDFQDHFEESADNLASMIRIADIMMYENKRKRNSKRIK